MKSILSIALMVSGFGLLAGTGDVLRFSLPGFVELELVEVSGTSRLPVESFFAGGENQKLDTVTLPTYWIGKFEVMQKQFEAVMGRNPSKVKGERLPVTDVEWIDAVDFCDRLNACCKDVIPKGYRFDLPTVVEWAHAFRGGREELFDYAGGNDLDAVAWHGVDVGDGKIGFEEIHIVGIKKPNQANAYDMSGNVAEYIFLGGAKQGNQRMGGSVQLPEDFCRLDSAQWGKRHDKSGDVGFRVALVPIAAKDPDGKSSSLCTKGKILLYSGYADWAKKYLKVATELKGFPDSEILRAKQALEQASAKRDCDYDTLPGLLSDIVKKVSEAQYRDEVLSDWLNPQESEDDRKIKVAHYRAHKIYGMKVAMGDLPKMVRDLMDETKEGAVQAVSCDFTGDGLNDLVVNLPGTTDADGESYAFFRREAKGGYVLVGEPIRNVGMCVVPSRSGKVGVVMLFKFQQDTLVAGLFDYGETNGAEGMRIAWLTERPVCIQDLNPNEIYEPVPFIGGYKGCAWSELAARGKYRRPLYWPWKN